MSPADLSFIDLLSVPASIHDREGRILHANRAAEEASGLTLAQLRGRSLFDPIPGDDHEHVARQFRRALNGEPAEFETSFVDAAGVLRRTRAQHLPLWDGDDVEGVLILAWEGGNGGSLKGSEPTPALTSRQLEILELLAAGRSTSEIACHLSISLETVRNHVRALFRELGSHTRVEALATAHRYGLLSPAPLARSSAR